MTLRANRPFRLKANGEARIFLQGQTFELDQEAGERLLSKAPGLVSAVFINMNVGEVVRWCSPLFGNMQGTVLLSEGQNVLVSHSIIGQPAWICRSWLIEKGDL